MLSHVIRVLIYNRNVDDHMQCLSNHRVRCANLFIKSIWQCNRFRNCVSLTMLDMSNAGVLSLSTCSMNSNAISCIISIYTQ